MRPRNNGVYERPVSSIGQLTIPVEFREDGVDKYDVVQESDGTIILHPTDGESFNPSQYRERAIAEYGRECVECGTNSPLHVHHKDGNKSNHEIENLEVLCPNCHTQRHQNATEGKHPVNIRVRVPKELSNEWKAIASEHGLTYAQFANTVTEFVRENKTGFGTQVEQSLRVDVSNSDINIRIRCADEVRNKWKGTTDRYDITYGEYIGHTIQFLETYDEQFRRFVYEEERSR